MSMRKYPMIRITSMVIIALSMTVMMTTVGFAQGSQAAGTASAQAQQAFRMTLVHLKPGMGSEWNGFIKNNVVPLMKKAGIQDLRVSQINVFGEGDTYYMMSPIANLSDLDGPNPIAKAAGQDDMAVLTATLQHCVSSMRTFMLTARPDLGIAPKQGYTPKMGVLVTTSVAPGRTEEYEKNIKQVVTVIGKTNAKAVMAGKVGLGGNPNQYLMFVAFDSFADVQAFPAAFAKAAAATKLDSQAGIVQKVEWVTLRMLPELGIQPPAK
jgi:hypothetical protein